MAKPVMLFPQINPAMLVSPRHQCMIYEGAPSQTLALLAQALIERLKKNYRCLYLNSPPMLAGMRCQLSAAGLDIDEQTKRGALILSSERAHLIDGKFEIDKMMQLLKDNVQQALADGFAGLWATGDMTWEFGNEKNLDKLMEYETRLEEFMRNNPALGGICQYHRDTLPLHALKTAVVKHPSPYISATLLRLNPPYDLDVVQNS